MKAKMENACLSPAFTARYGRKKLPLRIFVPLVVLLPSHEDLRVLLDLLSHSRMGAQELPQLRMTIQIILVIQQAWIFLKIFGDLRMRVEKGVEIPQFAVGDIFAGILETLLALHEALRILADLLAHAWVILQISREVGMFIDEILVVDQRRVPS